MNTQEIASDLVNLCKEGKFEEAGEKYWAEDVISIEAMPGEMSQVRGKQAVRNKGEWWYAHNEVHDVQVDGPYVNGDQFAVHFRMDVTPKEGGQRQTMDEVGLYTVRDGRIAEERFFYS